MRHSRFFAALSALFLLAGGSAMAGVTAGAGTWVGQGEVFNLDGKALGAYSLEMDNMAIGAHAVQSQITVTLPDGTRESLKQTLSDTDQGFSIVSDYGSGGGYCLGEGLCLAYASNADHHAYAMTIVIDSASTERLIRTELQGDHAVRIYREKLLKLN